MAKLTRLQRKQHLAAVEILKKDALTEDEKEFVFNHWHEGAQSMNGEAGAFFTPLEMAYEFAYDCGGDSEDQRTYIDLCAGIGVLAYALKVRYPQSARMVCIEVNPEYVEVGKKLVPEAEWYCLDVMDNDALISLGHFHTAVSNPPFGLVSSMRGQKASCYSGAEGEYKVISQGGLVADSGTFILPQQSAGFRYSGANYYERDESSKYKKFSNQTGLSIDAGMGFDTTAEGMGNFKDVSLVVEFGHVDYDDYEIVEKVGTLDLFAA